MMVIRMGAAVVSAVAGFRKEVRTVSSIVCRRIIVSTFDFHDGDRYRLVKVERCVIMFI
ncbi:uncharacterized protein Dmul_05860 [Desulfococcus multivorans]|nr:uncharacterized protein Dmul_05860 [Desulfococcus multivorans]